KMSATAHSPKRNNATPPLKKNETRPTPSLEFNAAKGNPFAAAACRAFISRLAGRLSAQHE
ncbi:MAG TPA: hypothetical protein PLS31_00700, partial [Candidatus Sumerlaeota bacterium]|nr:hypothetical protein [Candidatus Sumerlaeota bacterium]